MKKNYKQKIKKEKTIGIDPDGSTHFEKAS